MKLKNSILSAAILCSFFLTINSTFAQGTAFTYQGRLNNGTDAATGSYDLTFALFNVSSGAGQVGVTMTNSATAVTNGLFTVTLDFGNQFPGANRWLEIGVRSNGIASFTTLAPRQPLTPAPYAVFAGTASNVSGTISAAQLPAGIVTNNAAGLNLAGSFTGNGANVTNVNAVTLNGVSSAGFWKTNGNTGANPANGAYLGTADNLPVEFKVNGKRVLRLEPNSTSPNTIGGFASNSVSSGVFGAFIGGGGNSFGSNSVSGNYGSVVGGANNTASGDYSTVMGINNIASGDVSTAMGAGCTALGNNSFAMGYSSEAGGFAALAVGYANTADGYNSVAMGQQASALHNSTFVWADSQLKTFSSTANDQFLIRAQGGVILDDSTPSVSFGSSTRQMLNLYNSTYGVGVQSSTLYQRSSVRFSWYKGGVHSDTQNDPGTGGSVLMTLTSSGLTVNGTLASTSDRNAKEDFAPVDSQEVLARVATMPITKWTYKTDTDTRHIGPMAQDFYAAFKVGPDDKHITTVDEGGVALAAIQGLNQKLETENAELKARLEKLEQLVSKLSQAGSK